MEVEDILSSTKKLRVLFSVIPLSSVNTVNLSVGHHCGGYPELYQETACPGYGLLRYPPLLWPLPGPVRTRGAQSGSGGQTIVIQLYIHNFNLAHEISMYVQFFFNKGNTKKAWRTLNSIYIYE